MPQSLNEQLSREQQIAADGLDLSGHSVNHVGEAMALEVKSNPRNSRCHREVRIGSYASPDFAGFVDQLASIDDSLFRG